MLNTIIYYFIIGVLFVISINLSNILYRELVLFNYKWSKNIQITYFIYMYTVVILFWPLFTIAYISDYINNFINKNNE